MTTLTSTTTHTNTLMQAALVTASGPATSCQARILIDTGSQKTFITQYLKNKLHLKAVQNEKLYPLEVLAEEDNLQGSEEKFKNHKEIRSTGQKRTQRAAAQRAAIKINELSKLNEL